MKKLFFSILFIIIFTFGCNKTNDTTNTCQNITSFSVTQSNGSIIFSLDNNSIDTYEISYNNTNINTNPDFGSIIIGSSTTLTKDMVEIGIYPDKSYTFSVRKICSSTSKSEWGLTKTLLTTNFCNIPKQLKVESNIASWQLNNLNSTASYSQIQYGLSGFSLGNGTIANVNNQYFYDAVMLANNTYDFYVRNYCINNLGWSNWVGPYTYLCTTPNNICITPTNINYIVARNGSGSAVGASFSWTSQGLTNFEYAVVAPNSTLAQTQIKANTVGSFPTVLLIQNTNYTFYLRGVCGNNVYTNWSAPLPVNIGN